MSKEYRIKEYDYGFHHGSHSKRYIVQKKSFLRFWYNPYTGASKSWSFDTLKEAKEMVKMETNPIKVRIVKSYG